MQSSGASRLSRKAQDEFKRIILSENLARFNTILVLSISLNLFILALEWRAFGHEVIITRLRVLEIAAALLYLVVIRRPGQQPYLLQKGIFLSAVSLGLFLSAMISAQVSSSQGSTIVFIIGMMVVSTFLILPLSEMLGVLAPGLIYQAVAILLWQGTDRAVVMPGNVINTIAMALLSLMIAHVSLNARCQRFAYELVIRENNEFLKTIAAIDGLTGVANRRKIDETAAEIQALASREQAPVAVIMADLDNFKAYNDSCGHLAGDELLKATATAMKGVLQRESDFFGRYGGEEFVAILPFTQPASAAAIAEKMRQAVFDLGIPHSGSAAGVATVSAGVAAGIPSAALSLGEIVRRADEALYRAKQLGRNRVES